MIADFAHFNSIKVRLELDFINTCFILHIYFNSIKVRLEHDSVVSLSNSNQDFNSIKVRLERHLLWLINVITIFQFHKGTIRTRYALSARLLTSLFQFHKGTIRTR